MAMSDACWRATDYLTVGQIWLQDNHLEDASEVRDWRWSEPG